MKIRSSTSSKYIQSKFEPYMEIPFTPIKCLKPVLQRIHSEPQVVTQYKKVRGLAKKVIEGHFAQVHQRYKNKQNTHINSFKIKTKKKDISSHSSLQVFFEEKSNERQKELRHMHQQYLKDIRRELQMRKDQSQTESEWNKQQKIIYEYNIVYEYKVGSLPADLLQ